MYKSALILSMLIGFCWSCSPTPEPSATESRPTNIVIIFADDLGYGDLSCYGHPDIETKHLDQMAEEGIRFTSFYAAASVCTPSRAALLTGRHPIRHTPNNFGPESTTGLPLDETTLADMLQNKGYATMAVGKWHLGHLPPYLPTARGFDAFYGLPYSNDMILPWCPWLTEDDKLFLYEDSVAVKEIGFEQDDLTLNYTRKAVEFIQNHQETPFFLYFAHSMPHLPISTSEQFLGQSKAGLYGDVVETIDWSVGQVLEAIKEGGIDDHTLVVFTSDNGPWQNLPDRMLQRGVERWHAGTAGLLRGAKATTYEGGQRVPAIMRWPNEIEQGIVNHEVVTTMDLLPTIAGITGASLPKEKKIDGRDISAVFSGGALNDDNYRFFYARQENLQAVRFGDWKLRYTEAEGYQLFNVAFDPGEMYNQAENHPELVAQLLREMQAFAEETGAKMAD